MDTLRTISGKEINIFWLAIQPFDGPMALEAQMSSIFDAFDFFKNTEDIQILTRVKGIRETTYEGYTQLTLVRQTDNDRVLVYLSKAS